MGSDEQAIREVHSTWIAAVNAGGLDRLLTLMTDDCVLLNPGRGPLGRDGFPAVFSSAMQQSRIHCISELQEVVVVGNLAYTRARDSLSVTPRAPSTRSRQGGPETTQPETTQLAGHRLTIWRKQSDGRWLLARDAHTLSPVQNHR